jgi:HlyD family type I secretion membrane fusion protein
MNFTDAVKQWAGRGNHPRLERGLAQLDGFISLLGRQSYQGTNPAVGRAYGPLRASMAVIVAISAIALVFGMAVPLESAAMAQGTVVVLSKRKSVQHLEGGIVKKILVHEGELVEQGQPLLEISDIAPKANREIVQIELWAEQASESRLQALQDGRTEVEFPAALMQAAKSNAELAKAVEAQRELFATQKEGQEGKLASLRQRIAQLREEIGGLNAQIESAESQLHYTQEEIDAVKPLLRQGLATRPRLLALERQAEEVKGVRGQNRALIAKAEQTITEIEMGVVNQQNEFATQIAQEWQELRTRLGDLHEKLRAASDVMERTVIAAPSEGVVTGLKVFTEGGVIAPGAVILDIVPQSDRLVVEVHVQPTDIDVVKPGLESRILFPAYKAGRLPLLSGKVTHVSADAFSEMQGLQKLSFYLARVEVDSEKLRRQGQPINLYPGMPAEVIIKTGSRSFFGYLFSPLTDSLDRAFKEE